MQFNTPPVHGHIIHYKDRSLRIGVPVLIVVDKPKFADTSRILSPRLLCRAMLDMQSSTDTISVLIDSAFSESVYELYTKTCTSMGADYISYTGTTPKFLRETTWWPVARLDTSRTVIGSSSWVWPSTNVEECALWLMNPSIDPISGIAIGAQWQRRETAVCLERLKVWANLDLTRVLGENRREVCEVVRLCQRCVNLPIQEFEYRLERLEREGLLY